MIQSNHWRRTPRAVTLTLLLLLTLLSAACLPGAAKDLNQQGDKALFDKKYEQAISYYSRSLAIYPDQEEVRLRLDSAKSLLRQIYVDKIYEIVDRPRSPVQDFLAAWKMSARLPKLGVDAARVASIRVDMSRRFARAEKGLRKHTEGHVYYLHLTLMHALVPDHGVDGARRQVGTILRDQHLQARAKADKHRRAGLALLHTTAAATFSPRDTGLWADAHRRRRTLLKKLSISVALRVKAARGGAGRLLGGLKRRLPSIFVTAPAAPLLLTLQGRLPAPDERKLSDRRSARCQVGTRRVPNPECPTLRRRAEAARAAFDAKKGALEAVTARCNAEPNTSTCTGNVAEADKRMRDARQHYEGLESKAGSCPAHIEEPIFKQFFYMRYRLQRQVTASAGLTLTRAGTVISARGVRGVAAAEDTYGDGLGCAKIAPDPLQLPSLANLLITAVDRMLDDSLKELHRMRRDKAKKQLAGGDTPDERFDSLVRARLVDATYPLARDQLKQTLTSMWGSDFKLTETILK